MNHFGQPRISKRRYLSWHHLQAAEHFAKQAKKIEDAHTGEPSFDRIHRAYVLAAISSSVAFLEAAVNEVFEDVVDKHPSYVGELDEVAAQKLTERWNKKRKQKPNAFWNKKRTQSELERSPILNKYQKALGACGAQLFDEKSDLYIEAERLIDLRNELTHAQPETENAADEDQVELCKVMSEKFAPTNMAASGDPYFPDQCLGAGCAQWAVNSARALADEFFARTKIKANYQRHSKSTSV